MNRVIIILLLSIPFTINAQVQDTTCFPNAQVQRIAVTIDSLNKTVEKQIEIITKQFEVIQIHEKVNSQNELLLDIRNKEVLVLNDALNHSLGLNTKITMKQKWYDSKYMYYLYGALTIYGGALVVSSVR